MTDLRRLGAATAIAAVALAGCTATADEGTVLATASPLEDATVLDRVTESATPTPRPTEAASATPSPSATPTPTPTATASPDETATEVSAPVDEAAALAAARARRAERAECGDDGIADDFHRVLVDRGDVLLVFVACFLGAYQANGELLAFDGALRAWPVEQWVEGAVVDRPEVVGDVYVAPDGLLENLQRYRSLGDCGLFQRWALAGERLELVEAREQQCSDDGLPVPPGEWPLVHGG